MLSNILRPVFHCKLLSEQFSFSFVLLILLSQSFVLGLLDPRWKEQRDKNEEARKNQEEALGEGW